MRINWDRCRNSYGSIDLVEAVKNFDPEPSESVVNYLNRIMSINPIQSRQVAAHILASVLTDEQVKS